MSTSLLVGVAGHRVLKDISPVLRGVEDALDRIQAAYPGRSLTALSCLAEGADRIVAEAVLRRPRAQLAAVIPFTESAYAQDFGPDGSASRVHYHALIRRATGIVRLPDCRNREQGYQQGSEYVADNCDVLLAVWNGQTAQGSGGTGEVVERVVAQGKPVVIVRAGNRKLGTLEPTSLGREQGNVIVRGLPDGG